MTNETPQITPATAWRQSEIVTLPSGKTARLRRPDVIDLIMKDGTIPDFFTPVIMAGLQGKASDQDGDQIEITPENLRGVFDMLNTITLAAFVEPAISDKPESALSDGEIGLQHVAFNDKVWIMNWAMGADAGKLDRFPAQTAGSVDAVSPGGSDQDRAVSDRRRRQNS